MIPLHKKISGLIFIVTLTLFTSFNIAYSANGPLSPYSANPFYWQDGNANPLVLIGGSDHDSIFQWDYNALVTHLNLLRASGGNYIRLVLNSRSSNPVTGDNDPNGYPHPFIKTGTIYNLDQWNSVYFNKLTTFLREAKNRNIFVGTIISKSNFSEHLRRNYLVKFRGDEKIIESFIDNLPRNWINLPSIYHDIKIKQERRIIWFTWDDKSNSDDPFYFLRSDYAAEARTALGIGHVNMNEKLLAFVFSVSYYLLHRPTFYDSDCNEYFRPTELSFDKYGIICPLNNGIYIIGKNEKSLSSDARNLPESVSNSINWTLKDVVGCKLLI